MNNSNASCLLDGTHHCSVFIPLVCSVRYSHPSSKEVVVRETLVNVAFTGIQLSMPVSVYVKLGSTMACICDSVDRLSWLGSEKRK